MLPVVDIVEVGAGGGSDRLDRRGRRAAGRPAQRRRRARPGLLRPRRHRADRHRRQRGARPPRRRRASSAARCRSTPRRAAAAVGAQVAEPLGLDPTEAAARHRARSPTRRWRWPCAASSVERGLDPRDFALVAFGGAGPLHAAAIAARAAASRRVVIPPLPGHFSALGHADGRRAPRLRAQLAARRWPPSRRPALAEAFAAMRAEGADDAGARGRARREPGARAQPGPALPRPGAHARRAARRRPARRRRAWRRRARASTPPTSAATATPPPTSRWSYSTCGWWPVARARHCRSRSGQRVKPTAQPPPPRLASSGWKTGSGRAVPIYARAALRRGDRLTGPAVVEEPATTLVLYAGDRLRVADGGHLIVEVGTP